MISILPILLRVVFVSALVTGMAGSFNTRIPPGLRKTGYTIAVIAAIALVILRIVLRVAVPEEVPSFSG